MKLGTGCVEECFVKEELRRPTERTLGAWMPRRSEVIVMNRRTRET